MKIVVDQNIPLAQEFFSSIGQVVALPGRSLSAKDLDGADILLVRSITQVNEALLSGSSIKFVGSCTIGIDHLDTQYLDSHNIAWANAPGCNANAVVQYVFSALAALRPRWQEQKIGIVGCGNIGGRLYRRLKKLGVDVVVYDPFLSSVDCANLRSLDEVLSADIITCHTPLTHRGKFPTYHLLDSKQLAQLSDTALLINSGRGAMINNNALLAELERRPLSVVLDVWENEPDIDRQLLEKVSLGTFHIAGYSVEGKEQGTYMVYKALCQFLNHPLSEAHTQFLSKDKSILSFEGSNTDKNKYDINQLLMSCYNIREDDEQLRQGHPFDDLRKQYISRREYSHFELPNNIVDIPSGSMLQHAFNIIKGAV